MKLLKADKGIVIKEAIVSGVVFLGVIYVLNAIALRNEFIKPIKQEFEDFDIYDMVFSSKHKQQEYPDTSANDNHYAEPESRKGIVIVEAKYGRADILEQLQTLQAYEPKVLGVDIKFQGERTDTLTDKRLFSFLNFTPNVIGGYAIDSIIHEKTYINNQPFILDEGIEQGKYGFFNFSAEEETNVIREFTPFYHKNGIEYFSFASLIVKTYDSVHWNSLSKRLYVSEYINYQGNINQFDNYPVVLFDSIKPEDIRDKIVLFGGFSRDNNYIDDLKFTPMNSKYSGRSFPDMHGIVVHANIIDMLLDEKKLITEVPTFWNGLLVFFLCTCYSFLVIKDYKNYGHASHIKYIIISTISIFLFAWSLLWLYDAKMIRLDLAPIIMSFVIPFELFEIYRRLALVFNKYFNYKTILINQH
ncbi:MAG: CHASE2 domain-containing protein [Bacteroidetes bacterium]|nr:CHASE2 domain-containing protein [Bacteroidota bacterium]